MSNVLQNPGVERKLTLADLEGAVLRIDDDGETLILRDRTVVPVDQPCRALLLEAQRLRYEADPAMRKCLEESRQSVERLRQRILDGTGLRLSNLPWETAQESTCPQHALSVDE